MRFLTLASTLALASSVSAQIGNTELQTYLYQGTVLNSDDALFSSNRYAVARVEPMSSSGKRFVVTWASIPIVSVSDSAVSFQVTSNGRIQVNRGTLPAYYSNAALATNAGTTSAAWHLRMQSNGNLVIQSISGGITTRGFDSYVDWFGLTNGIQINRIAALSGYEAINGDDDYAGAVARNWGSNSVIYVIDSGVSKSHDPADSISDAFASTDRNANNQFTNMPALGADGASSWYDSVPHGSRIMILLKSKLVGFTSGATMMNLKITNNNDRSFWQRAFIKALKSVVQDSTTQAFKIINWSGRFASANLSGPVKCALQWTYYANIPIIGAAGNDQDAAIVTSPYVLVVGAADVSGYGPYTFVKNQMSNSGAGVKIWGPSAFVSADLIGTSVAAPFVTGAVAGAFTRFPSSFAGKTPKFIYDYIVNSNTNVTVVGPTISYANLRSASPIVPPTTSSFVNEAQDSCFGYGPKMNPTSAQWDTLVNYAPVEGTQDGDVVTYLAPGTTTSTPSYTNK